MSLAIRLAALRTKRRSKKPTAIAAWVGWAIAALFSLGIAAFLLWTAWMTLRVTAGLPSLDLLPLLLDAPDGQLLQPTRLYDRTGNHVILTLESPATAGRQPIKIVGLPADQQPEKLIKAILVSIDSKFWESPGYTLEGLWEGTHPTLAQKLAHEFLLKDEKPSLRRNLRERLLAAQIIERFGRERVLEWYLNTAHFGPYIYGADAASRAYFNKSAYELTLAEAALLAAAAEAPGIHPYEAPQVSFERQGRILQAMMVKGWISSDELLQATQEKITLNPPRELENISPSFTALALQQLGEAIPQEVILRGGYRIITTLNDDLQSQSNCVAKTLLSRLEGTALEATEEPCVASRLLPFLASIKGDIPPGTLAAALAAIDPRTGQVLSMVGANEPGLNPARLPGRPPGSILSPIVYLSAFSRGFSPASMMWDIPSRAMSANEDAPGIVSDFHGPVRLRTALVNDYTGVAIQLFNQLGQENILRTARQLGLVSLDFLNQPSAVGQGYFGLTENRQLTLLEAVQAYAIFANQGTAAGWTYSGNSNASSTLQPATILRVEDSRGNLLLDWSKTASKPVLSRQLAYVMNHVLSDEVARWQSLGHPNPLEIGRPAAAKIGSTQSGAVEWTVGYTPQIAVGVWIGRVKETDIRPPALASAALWHAEMQYALRAEPAESWEAPPGLRFLDVCEPSGLLPTTECPIIVREVFLTGFEPLQADNLYRKVAINRETGRLATIFTPPELVVEETYLVVPSDAADWAAQAGLPLPPKDYDAITLLEATSSEAVISEPVIFSHVHGQVIIRGRAFGDGFQFYRLQIGQGVNPREWLQIGPDVQKAVEDGNLGAWDTQGLNGLYTVQLLVVLSNQRIERAVTQVTVDNTPPEISIQEPEGKAAVSQVDAPQLIRAEASDNIELERVDFYVDERLLVSLNKPPFVAPWKPTPGEHTLRVVAVDLAGNQSAANAAVLVKKEP